MFSRFARIFQIIYHLQNLATKYSVHMEYSKEWHIWIVYVFNELPHFFLLFILGPKLTDTNCIIFVEKLGSCTLIKIFQLTLTFFDNFCCSPHSISIPFHKWQFSLTFESNAMQTLRMHRRLLRKYSPIYYATISWSAVAPMKRSIVCLVVYHVNFNVSYYFTDCGIAGVYRLPFVVNSFHT